MPARPAQLRDRGRGAKGPQPVHGAASIDELLGQRRGRIKPRAAIRRIERCAFASGQLKVGLYDGSAGARRGEIRGRDVRGVTSWLIGGQVGYQTPVTRVVERTIDDQRGAPRARETYELASPAEVIDVGGERRRALLPGRPRS